MPVLIEKIAYQGWPNCYRISNREMELVVTSDVGPRILRCGFKGGQNLFKEYAEEMGRGGEREWKIRGGHRLWAGPEIAPITYALDNGPIEIQAGGGVLAAIQPVEPETQLEKRITVKLAEDANRVEVIHSIANRGPWPVEFAPWALTVLAPGGAEVTGFPPRGGHDDGGLLATNPLVMWAYTDLSDPRWSILRKYLILRQDSSRPAPLKTGLFNPRTWAAYVLGGEAFVKQTTADPKRVYPDFGCSFETFTNGGMLEMETLGPLEKVEPGASVEHIEHWSLHRGVQTESWTEAAIEKVILPLLA